jgi:hypothetical protein
VCFLGPTSSLNVDAATRRRHAGWVRFSADANAWLGHARWSLGCTCMGWRLLCCSCCSVGSSPWRASWIR